MKDYFNENKYRLFQTKTKIFSKNQNSYLNSYPQNQLYNIIDNNSTTFNNNYNYNTQYNPNKIQGATYIPLNVINNNISTNDRIYQKYFYINQRNTPLNKYNTNHANTTIHFNSQNKKRMQQYINARSPIQDLIENENFDFYIEERLKNNKRKNIEENNSYMNKTTGFKLISNNSLNKANRTNLSNFYTLNKNDSILKQNNRIYLNIYRNKIANNFVRIINKIIIKRKKIEIFQKFYNNLKKIYYLKGVKPNYLESKYDKDDPKYKEYKDMIYNYIKSKDDLSHSKIYNILKPEDKMKFNTINAIRKNNSKFKIKEENSSSNNTSIITEKKSAIQRFKQLQKKYGKIYEKKRNESISFEDRIKNYINHKTIDSTSSNNDNSLRRRKIIFKHVKRNDKIKHELNHTNENTDNDSIKVNINKNNIITEHKSNISKNKYDSKMSNSNKSFKSISVNRNKNIYKIFIIKNIITPDKRLYVNINYINLNNIRKKSEKKLYNNNILEISEIIDINYIGGKSNNKNNLGKHMKKLSKIEEEIDEKINTNLSMSIKDDNNKNKEENNNKTINTNTKGISNYNNLNKNIRKKYLYKKGNKNTNDIK